MLTNEFVQFLSRGGIMNITAHDLDVAHAYKVVKFKNAIKDALSKMEEMEKSFITELKIDDPQGFDQRAEELRKKESLTKEEQKELDDKNAIYKRLADMRMAMYQEEANVETKVMPYEEWKKLQDENRGVKIGDVELLMAAEPMLEGVLWKAPEESEE